MTSSYVLTGDILTITIYEPVQIPVMYSPRQLLRGFSNPKIGLREINRLYWDRGGSRSFYPDGVDIFEEDWDNLLILDGCRFDYFADLIADYDIDGNLDSRYSRGAATKEFLKGNFDHKRLHDVVYVTASTMLYQETIFHDNVSVELHDTADVWSNSIEHGQDGVPPESVAHQTRETVRKYPNKRLLVHFVQPHAPYIGPKGREEFPNFKPNPLSERFRGLIDTPTERLQELYEENLHLVLEVVEELLLDLPGKTVISADHGMLLGERERPIPIKSFGHPPRLYVEEMLRVPWHTVETGSRKRIVPEPPQSNYKKKRDDSLDNRARDHLRQMGYL